MDFGTYIRNLRKSKQLTLREAARRSEMSHPYLSQIENGKNTNPTPHIIKKLAKGLEVPYMQLMQQAGYTDGNSNRVAEALETRSLTDSRDLYTLLNSGSNLYYNGSLLSSEDKAFLLTVDRKSVV